MFVLVLKLKKVSSKIVTTKPVCVVLFKKRPLKKTVYTLSLEPGIWVYFRDYLTSRLRARVVWVAFLLCRTVQSTSTTHNLLVILLPQPPSKKLGVAAPGSHVGFCAGSVPLPATVNRNTLDPKGVPDRLHGQPLSWW